MSTAAPAAVIACLAATTAASITSGWLQLNKMALAPSARAAATASPTGSPERSTGVSPSGSSSRVNEIHRGFGLPFSAACTAKISAIELWVSASHTSTDASRPSISAWWMRTEASRSNKSGRYEPSAGGSEPATVTGWEEASALARASSPESRASATPWASKRACPI